MARDIMVPKAKTPVIPRSKSTGHNKVASRQMPGADTVVVHVGSNYIRRASSEHLKIDFKITDF
jgi:hypothetical protein